MMWTIYGGVGKGDSVLVNAVGGGVGLDVHPARRAMPARASSAPPARRARRSVRWTTARSAWS
jgi:hypothetical protein